MSLYHVNEEDRVLGSRPIEQAYNETGRPVSPPTKPYVPKGDDPFRQRFYESMMGLPPVKRRAPEPASSEPVDEKMLRQAIFAHFG